MREHEDIQEVKAMKFPPPRLALAFEVVGALLQKPHSGWEDAKKMIEDEKVKDVRGVFICFRRFSSDFHIPKTVWNTRQAFMDQLASLSIMDVPGEAGTAITLAWLRSRGLGGSWLVPQ